MSNYPPVIDLHQLTQDVLSREPEAALPCNLSDYWCEAIRDSLEQVLYVRDEESAKYFNGPMALVSHLLLGKTGAVQIEFDLNEILERFRDYRLELALEEVRRVSDIKPSAATLETIFTNRRVEFIRTAT